MQIEVGILNTMKTLIIDSHKGSAKSNNLHLNNARLIASHIGADLIWSYSNVNDLIFNDVEGRYSDYNLIIFNHASAYSFTDYEWIKRSPKARLVFISNEFNLGESRTLWMAIKQGRRYEVIAN